jgi:cyclopropane-fatty-acyl-phospholipid synthase
VKQELSRRFLLRLLSGIRHERLEIVAGDKRYSFGDPAAKLRAAVTIHDDGVWRQVLRGSTGLAETYMDGRWDVDDPVRLIRIAARNMGPLDRAREFWHPVLHSTQRLTRMIPSNDHEGSRANISAHYDLGNRLFSLFLDPTLTYSAAYFESPQVSLEDAQRAKLERICTHLQLGPDDHLLEIGTGWGSMAIHAAARYGCRVTTTTISREQHDVARRRVREAGVEGLVEVLLEDYRDLTGTYSKLVSIEMIEAVGWQYFDTYFRRCSELLEPNGLMLLQAITADDRVYKTEKASKSFINTLIFPGGCLPSLEVIHDCLAGETDMRTIWLDDITHHYSETLRRWREDFVAHTPEAEALGYDVRFRRMWALYLAYVEAGFTERRIGDVQMLLAKPEWRGEVRGPVLARPTPGLRSSPWAGSVPRLAAEHPAGDLVK